MWIRVCGSATTSPRSLTMTRSERRRRRLMSVVLLDDMKRFGNFQKDSSDGDIQATIDAAEVIAAHWVGPLAPMAVTQRVYDTSLAAVLTLNSRPVVSVTSV